MTERVDIDADVDTPPGVRMLRRASDKHPTWKHVAYGAVALVTFGSSVVLFLWNKAEAGPDRARAVDARLEDHVAAENRFHLELQTRLENSLDRMEGKIDRVEADQHAIGLRQGVRLEHPDGGR